MTAVQVHGAERFAVTGIRVHIGDGGWIGVQPGSVAGVCMVLVVVVTEVLDTVDFGVVRFAVGGDVVYENDAVGRLGGAMPRLHAAADTRVLLREDG